MIENQNFITAAFICLWIPTLSAAQTAVTDPTGTVVGEIDGASFELPVICEEAGNWFVARSHDFGNSPDPQNVDAAIMIAIPPTSSISVKALLGGRSYEFGSAGVDAERNLSFDSTISGSEGEYQAQFELNCDG